MGPRHARLGAVGGTRADVFQVHAQLHRWRGHPIRQDTGAISSPTMTGKPTTVILVTHNFQNNDDAHSILLDHRVQQPPEVG
jgi:hypothetical protein